MALNISTCSNLEQIVATTRIHEEMQSYHRMRYEAYQCIIVSVDHLDDFKMTILGGFV